MDQLRSDPPLSEDLPLLEGQPLSGERPLPDQQNAAACKIQVLILLILPKPETRNPETLSHTMDSLLSFRKSTPSQNRQLDILISNSKQQAMMCGRRGRGGGATGGAWASCAPIGHFRRTSHFWRGSHFRESGHFRISRMPRRARYRSRCS